jgi:predicted secreted protein
MMRAADHAVAWCRRGALAILALSSVVVWSGAAQAEPLPPTHVVTLSASGFMDVPQDWLSITLSIHREGSDAAALQAQIKQALESALTLARAAAAPGQLELRSGPMGLYPRYGSNGKTNGWSASAELVIEGRDFVRVSSAAGSITTLNVSGMAFSLSREARQKLESDVQAMAIERFKARAAEVARSFGFQGYALREITVGSTDQGATPYPRAMAMRSKAELVSADAPVPVEAGKSQLSVLVSGSIQLR